MNKSPLLLGLVLTISHGSIQPAVLAAEESPATNATSVAPEKAEWTLVELNGKAFVAPPGDQGAPTLRVDAGFQSVSGFAGVNRFQGKNKQTGDKVQFGPLISTRMAGSPEAMAVESAFLAALGNVNQWRVSDQKLELLHQGQVIARFKAGPVPQK